MQIKALGTRGRTYERDMVWRGLPTDLTSRNP